MREDTRAGGRNDPACQGFSGFLKSSDSSDWKFFRTPLIANPCQRGVILLIAYSLGII